MVDGLMGFELRGRSLGRLGAKLASFGDSEAKILVTERAL